MKTRAMIQATVLALAIASFARIASAQQTQSGVIIEQVPATPPAVPASPPPEQKPEPPKKEKSVPAGIRVDGGYGLRTLQQLPVSGADFGLAIGAQPAKHFAIYGAARGFFGSTEHGLSVKALRLTCDFDIVIDRFRIGFDPGLFIVGVDRATRSSSIVGWGPKIGVALRVDVVRVDPFALFLRASADGGPTFNDGSLFGGFMFGAGIDFDIKPGDRESL